MAKYGRKAQSSVKSAMHKKKQGTLHSGKGKKRVKSRKQAIAIGLSEARKKGAKVPRSARAGKRGGIGSESSTGVFSKTARRNECAVATLRDSVDEGGGA